VNAKQIVSLLVLVTFVFVTGMAPLCLCRCCETAPSASQSAQTKDTVENRCCGVTSETLADRRDSGPSPHSKNHRIDRETDVGGCSCDFAAPAKLEAIAADTSVFHSKLAFGFLARAYDGLDLSFGETRTDSGGPLLEFTSPSPAFLNNCSFLC